MAFQTLQILLLWLSYGSLVSAASLAPREQENNGCYYLPGDRGWPSMREWQKLNSSVSGGLLAAVPVAKVCYESGFNSSQCKHLQDRWEYPDPHELDPFSIMMPYWLNDSCSPYPGSSSSCQLGNLVQYTVNVGSVKDVVAGLKFVKEKNIRLVVKNTGHDYLGRSTGKGALGLWMHNLKNITFLEYNSSSYRGGAVRMQSGVQAFEINQAAYKRGLRIVTGFCPTVGIAGGYTTGGGHSPLASAYGLAADNTLEFEVVTTDGQYLVVNREQHSDLFWALSGGAAGNFAVIMSATVKTFHDGPVGGALLSMNRTDTDAFWNMVTAWQTLALDLNKLPGLQTAFTITQTLFLLDFITWPGHTGAEIEAAISPFLKQLKANNFAYNLSTSTDKAYYEHYSRYTPEIPFGTYTISQVLGGRLIPRKTVENNVTALTAAIRTVTNGTNFQYTGLTFNVSHETVGNKPSSNAVLPAWRNALFSAYTQIRYDPKTPIGNVREFQRETNDDVIAKFRELTPGSGTYMNEGTFDNVYWKEDYFGSNYDRLLSVKRKYDPSSLLYGRPNPGHEDFIVASDGRLCKKK